MIHSNPIAVTASPESIRWFWPCVAGCLVLQALLAADCARQWSPTHDEYWHLPIGLRMWKTARFDDDVINPPPVRLWAALPLVVGGAIPGDVDSRLDVGQIGDAFWSANGDRGRYWFALGRLMIVPLLTVTGIAIAVWSRAWYGDRAALISVLLWTCCPTALANGAIVTHDLPLAAAWVVTLMALVRFAEAPSWQRALGFGFMLGVSLLTKLTAIILVPLSIVLWVLLRGRSSPAGKSQAARNKLPSDPKAGIVNPVSRWNILAYWAAALLLALFLVNACYLFRGTGTSLNQWNPTSSRLKSVQHAISSVGWIPLPLPRDYIAAIDRLAQDLESKHPVYLNNEWQDRPFAWYYAFALAYKLPLSTLALTFIALCALVWPRPESRDCRHGLCLLIAAGLLPLLASRSSNQIGIRYVLPTIPLLCIFAGQSARWLQRPDPAQAMNRLLWLTVWVAVIAAPLSLRFHPYHLAYFNSLAGGPSGGGWHLLDSNIDWGQDLHALQSYLKQHQIQDVGLAYFGTVIPPKDGIKYHAPPQGFPQPGWYAISVNFVHGRPHVLRGENGDRVQVGLGGFSYFRFFEPVVSIGYSINVYHLTQQDVSRYAFALNKQQNSK